MSERRTDREPPGGGRFDEEGDATRRTWLATERTFLAWWRTGLTAFAVSLGAGRIAPAVAGGSEAAYGAVGVLFAVLGILILIYGRQRSQEVKEALHRGEYLHADSRMLSAISVLAAIGGVALIVLIILGR